MSKRIKNKQSGRLDQHLEEISYLKIEYPNRDNGFYVPIYENPVVSETKKARYATYNPIGRSNPLFAYLGSNARVLKLEFPITLDHVRSLGNFSNKSIKSTIGINPEEDRRQFFQGKDAQDYENAGAGSVKQYASDYKMNVKFPQMLTALPPGMPIGVPGITPSFYATEEQLIKASITGVNAYTKAIDTVVNWINLIRSSVYNNASNPTEGPPVVRLFHGILYQGIPCVCMSYTVEHEEAAGYDPATMFPRRLRLGLELHEHRAGNFGKYDITQISSQNGDNLTGWESVIEPGIGTMDSVPFRFSFDQEGPLV